ncbi:MAG: hypothetical protein WBL06_05485 [Pseudolysinimonas sp.]|jgi:hypothetical protein|uniref:hypothetical protein n=1 Tax=Pseudolysinimonas sp. TaxID=2680009 RepID=UPI003C745370
MTEYTVNATLTVSGDATDKATIQAAVDAGLKELPSVAARYGFTVSDVRATIDEG